MVTDNGELQDTVDLGTAMERLEDVILQQVPRPKHQFSV